MNPPTFYGSKVDDEPHNFLDEVWKLVDATEVTNHEKADLDACQLKL